MSYNRIATPARLRTALINGNTVRDRSLAELAGRLTVDPKTRTTQCTIADGRPAPAALMWTQTTPSAKSSPPKKHSPP